MRVRLRLYGVFKSAANASELEVDLPDQELTVRSVIDRLVSRSELRNLKSLLLDPAGSDPRRNALIMVSGREINTLCGLDTKLTESDEIALLPVAHGG